MRRFSLQAWTVPLALFALVLFAYGLSIPWLGLYGDDWPYLWVHHVAGAKGYIDFVAWDRPFSAWIYLLATPILGETVWGYHLFLALLRWVDAVLLWWVMKLLWPDRQRLAVWTAFLFVVYPGFRQQPIPLEFMLHFSTLALFFFSLAAMLLAVRRPKQFWLFTILNMIAAASMFGLEYYVGLELLRPVFLWLVLSETIPAPRRRAGRALLYWLPNLLVLAAFVVWRVFIFSFRTYKPEFLTAFSASPLRAVYTLALQILTDLRAATFGAWRQVFAFPHEPSVLWLYGLVFLSVLAVVILTLLPLNRRGEPEGQAFLPGVFLLGLFALFIAGWPFWLTGLPVSLSFPWDRSTLAFMLGASWLLAGLVEMFKPHYQVYLLALLVALAAGMHLQNAADYRAESRKLRDFFWQLAWRAPGLQPGTILLSEQIPLNYYGDNGLTPPLNWTYAPGQRTTRQVYNFFDLDERLDTTLPALEEDLAVERTYRSFSFAGSTSDILMVYYRPDRCLRVLGPKDNLLPDLPRRLSESLALSHLDQIVTAPAAPARPPANLIGPEPEHGWCYYFQSGDLARQRQDWSQVAALEAEALSKKLSPGDVSEWLPFLEAALHQKNWQHAENLSASILQNGDLQPALCRVWKTALEGMSLSESEQKNVKTTTGSFKCKK